MALASTLRRFASNRRLAPELADDLLYWRSQRLYWEGVTHPDGGEREEQAEIHAAEGAETAIRRLADRTGVTELPGEKLTHALGLYRLRQSLEDDERAALKTLDHVGPSRRIDPGERLEDYMRAADAERLLELLDRVHEYLDWSTGPGERSLYPEERR